jgi:hypothetical protein
MSAAAFGLRIHFPEQKNSHYDGSKLFRRHGATSQPNTWLRLWKYTLGFPLCAPAKRKLLFHRYSPCRWFIHIAQSPHLRRSPRNTGGKKRSPSTEPHADGRRHKMEGGLVPQGDHLDSVLLPQCHAAFCRMPSTTLAWITRALLARLFRNNPLPHTCYHLPRDSDYGRPACITVTLLLYPLHTCCHLPRHSDYGRPACITVTLLIVPSPHLLPPPTWLRLWAACMYHSNPPYCTLSTPVAFPHNPGLRTSGWISPATAILINTILIRYFQPVFLLIILLHLVHITAQYIS